jgi:hypothetical protein
VKRVSCWDKKVEPKKVEDSGTQLKGCESGIKDKAVECEIPQPLLDDCGVPRKIDDFGLAKPKEDAKKEKCGVIPPKPKDGYKPEPTSPLAKIKKKPSQKKKKNKLKCRAITVPKPKKEDDCKIQQKGCESESQTPIVYDCGVPRKIDDFGLAKPKEDAKKEKCGVIPPKPKDGYKPEPTSPLGKIKKKPSQKKKKKKLKCRAITVPKPKTDKTKEKSKTKKTKIKCPLKPSPKSKIKFECKAGKYVISIPIPKGVPCPKKKPKKPKNDS